MQNECIKPLRDKGTVIEMLNRYGCLVFPGVFLPLKQITLHNFPTHTGALIFYSYHTNCIGVSC